MKIHSPKTNIGIRHFKAALAVAQTRSFVRAAEYLNVVPSALTETIRQLEAESGVQLFDRRARPVALTPAGEELVARAQRIVTDFDGALLDMRRIGGLNRGSVKVGAAPSMAHFPLSPAIAAFRKDHPAIDVTVSDDIAERLGAMVMDGMVDFALAERWHETEELSYEPLLADPFVLVCHRDHALATRDAVSLADIPAEDMIMLEPSTGIGKLLAGEGILPDAFHDAQLRATGTISLLIMISQGMGLSLMPRLAASVIQSSQIVQVRLSNLQLERRMCIVQRARSTPTPAAKAMLAHLKTVVAQGPDEGQGFRRAD